MARQRGTDENSLKLFETLQNDLKNLSIETKKKFPHIKEVSISFAFSTPFYLLTNIFSS